jgi:hypothetical protein
MMKHLGVGEETAAPNREALLGMLKLVEQDLARLCSHGSFQAD